MLKIVFFFLGVNFRNYTITLSYVSPEDSISPRSNLEARDKSSSDGTTHFPYPGQAFVSSKYGRI